MPTTHPLLYFLYSTVNWKAPAWWISTSAYLSLSSYQQWLGLFQSNLTYRSLWNGMDEPPGGRLHFIVTSRAWRIGDNLNRSVTSRASATNLIHETDSKWSDGRSMTFLESKQCCLVVDMFLQSQDADFSLVRFVHRRDANPCWAGVVNPGYWAAPYLGSTSGDWPVELRVSWTDL